ncbi:MAG TPA: SMI1/KNR4 family protein [Kofleriaceae bacterium]
MAKAKRKRPAGVPKQAEWTPASYWWHVDPKTRVGRRWDDRGRVICDWTEDAHGKPHGVMRDYHRSGAVAAETPYVHGDIRGTEIEYAPTRGNSGESEKVRRLERVWLNSRSIATTKFFDVDGRLCDVRGRPLGAKRAAQKSAKAITKQFPRKPKETFEQAIDRGRRWFAALLASGHGAAVRESFPRAGDPLGIVSSGKPAIAATIARIEKALGALPESYKRFLRTHGSIELLDGWTTQPPADVISESKRIGKWIGVLRKDAEIPADTKPQRWVMIAQLGEEIFAYALDLPKSPIVHLYLDDGPEYEVTGSFDVWMSDAIDRVTAEVAHALG